MITKDGLYIIGTAEVGGRGATRVTVREGAYAGRQGVVVRVHHEASVLVRLDMGRTTLELPFGPSELAVR